MFASDDLKALEARGITPKQAEAQFSLFKNPPPHLRLERACSAGDGILRLSESELGLYEERGAALLRSGRVGKFVPASGAATRMFQALQADPQGPQSLEVLKHFKNFAFANEFEMEGDKIAALLKRYANEPKALIPFHWHGDHSHTAFEDQIREALALGIKKIHFTISPEHRAGFESLLEAMHAALECSFSEQKASTDTLAADARGDAFRDDKGRILFRPGGHGALLENLNELHGDVVLIKNIDNIAHSRLWPELLRWKKILLGVLDAQTQDGRPVRVAGVVKNTGEPGGGPFWVRRREGKVDLQIVESAQIDMADPAQKAIFMSSTHFNPVDLACSLKGFDLKKYRDDQAVFISQKSKSGKALQALELPGLWNGAMADWKSVFLEVPLESFNPVKSINDLLRPAHQAE